MTRGNALLQRRCLLVIAAWASSLTREWRPAVYGVTVDVLRAPTSDAAVQLTAVSTLRTLVEDFDFVDEQLVPFLQPLLSHLPALVQQCSSADSHVRSAPPMCHSTHVFASESQRPHGHESGVHSRPLAHCLENKHRQVEASDRQRRRSQLHARTLFRHTRWGSDTAAVLLCPRVSGCADPRVLRAWPPLRTLRGCRTAAL